MCQFTYLLELGKKNESVDVCMIQNSGKWEGLIIHL